MDRISHKNRRYYTGLIPMPGQHLAREIRGRSWSMKMGIRPEKCRHGFNPEQPSHHSDPLQPEIVIWTRELSSCRSCFGPFYGFVIIYTTLVRTNNLGCSPLPASRGRPRAQSAEGQCIRRIYQLLVRQFRSRGDARQEGIRQSSFRIRDRSVCDKLPEPCQSADGLRAC